MFLRFWRVFFVKNPWEASADLFLLEDRSDKGTRGVRGYGENSSRQRVGQRYGGDQGRLGRRHTLGLPTTAAVSGWSLEVRGQ